MQDDRDDDQQRTHNQPMIPETHMVDHGEMHRPVQDDGKSIYKHGEMSTVYHGETCMLSRWMLQEENTKPQKVDNGEICLDQEDGKDNP